MIPVLLLYKILQFAVIMVFGFVLVKLKIIKSNDSAVLSKISLYLLMPAAIINSFDIEMTQDVVSGFTLAVIAAIVIHIVLLIVDVVCRRVFKCTDVERASIVYSNAANLIIPIVSYILGSEWVIYSCAFVSVQLIFLWTHGIQLFSSEKGVNIKKILLNVNIIAILIGFVLLIFGIRLPKFAKEVSSSLGDMLGVVGMLIAGMMAAEVDFKRIMKNKRLYLVLLMRMVVCPCIILVVIKYICLVIPVMNTEKILLISFLASMTPSAATIIQFAQLNNKDAEYAVAINIVTTLACLITMPIFVAIYQM